MAIDTPSLLKVFVRVLRFAAQLIEQLLIEEKNRPPRPSPR
jgi:hypothetical protein